MEDTLRDAIPSASVHPPEINVEQPDDAPVTPPEEIEFASVGFRHAGWKSYRNRVFDAFCLTNQKHSRRQRFSDCGSKAWLAADPENPTHYKVTCDRCHDRFCLPCANELARHSARVIAEYVKGKELRFVTLTLKTDDEPLADSLTRLVASFRRLRNRPFWKRHVRGGASFIEVKWNAESNRWHPHLHVITTGRFMPVTDLKQEWYTATGDSWIVDVRAVKDNDRAASYLAKYASKGYSSSIFHDKARLEEAILALHGRRLMMCFGNWRGFSIHDDDNEERWTPVCPLSQIRELAAAGSKWASRLLQHLADPDNYHSPGVMPPEETIKLGRDPPPGTMYVDPDDGQRKPSDPYMAAHPGYTGLTPEREVNTYTVEKP